jgi:hypothetical protein
MSGVIDADGTQWERCNGCGEFVRIDQLQYEKPSAAHEFGRDLCWPCRYVQTWMNEDVARQLGRTDGGRWPWLTTSEAERIAADCRRWAVAVANSVPTLARRMRDQAVRMERDLAAQAVATAARLEVVTAARDKGAIAAKAWVEEITFGKTWVQTTPGTWELRPVEEAS